MKKPKLVALLLTFLLLACTYGTTPFILESQENGAPKAVQGTIDLSSWDFGADGMAKLDGEWEFYPEELLEPSDFLRHSPQAQPVAVPGSWSGSMPLLGSATYRLKLVLGEKQEAVYGMKTLSIQMSARIFVNGQSIGSSGNPALDETYLGGNKPIIAYFNLRPGSNEIIVQVSNYDFPGSSGIKHSITLGSSQHISALRDKALTYDWITVISFLIMGIYFVGLYIQRSKDYYLAIFGFLCFCFAIYSATRGERVVYEVFDSMPGWLFLQVQFLSTVGVGIGLFCYVYTVFRPFCAKWLVQSGLIAGACLTVLYIFFLPLTFQEAMVPITTIYATFPMLYAMYIFVLASLHRVEGSLYLVGAVITLNVCAFIQNLNVYFAVPVYIIPPVQPFLFLLMLALLMSLRFANAFKLIESLSGKLVQADQLKDEFLTKTAHEFKTPLHGIMNIAQSMIERGNETHETYAADRHENLNLIYTTAKRLSQLVYDILDFSRLKQGELTVNPVPIDVRSNVEVTLKVFSFLTAGKPIELINRVPDSLPYILADEIRFRQIVSNLLDNAVKYTERGMVEVSAAEVDGMIEVRVQDTGIGINETDIPVIFEPFKSLNMDSDQSMGLGLPIVKQLVELQAGSIRVSSELGVGTGFTFRMPIAIRDGRAKAAEAAAVRAPEYVLATPYVSERKGTHTILTVDDNTASLKVLIDLLERLHYTVIAVKSGLEALQQLEERPSIDLVILDLMMPGLSGFEVCRAIRSKHGLLHMPVLMVTASIQQEVKLAAFDAGANDYLSKPFDGAELRARVNSQLIMKDSVGKAVGMEVAFLQSQIKPHFLYNVLNTIMALSYTDPDASRKLTTDLADYLRGSFQFFNTKKTMPFSHELDLIRTYADIEKTRFKNRIHVEYDISSAIEDLMIPPLLIQPLVENAIRHGVGQKLKGGTVQIHAYEAEGSLCIEVEDSGVGMSQERLNEVLTGDPAALQATMGVGVRNISKRLRHFYGTDLVIVSEPGVGTKVTMRIQKSLLSLK